MLGPVAVCSGVVLVAGGAGAWLLPLRDRRDRLTLDELTTGLIAGLAIQVLLLQALYDRLGASTFWIAAVVGASGWAFGLAWCLKRRTPLGFTADAPTWATLAATALTLLVAVLPHQLPRGHDPVFHAILTQKLIDDGHLVRDWTPFERVPVLYPQGSHLLLAMICQLTGLEPPTAFQASFAWAGVLEALALWSAAGVFCPAPAFRLAAVALHTAAARFGSPLHIQLWGGLPTLIGSSFVLGLIARLPGPIPRPRANGGAIGLFLAALLTVHHLTALIAIWLLGLWWLRALPDRSASGRSLRQSLSTAALVTLVLALPSLAGYASRIGEIGHTHTLRYGDEPSSFGLALAESLGWTLLPWTLLGIVGIGLRRVTLRHTTDLVTWAIGLTIAYLALDVAYRHYGELAHGRSVSAFTPSRWLTALTTPLSLIGAAPFAPAAVPIAPRRLLGGLLAATLALGLGWTLRDVWTTRSRAHDDRALFAWVNAQTPPEAFLILDVPERLAGNPWMPYLTGRESFVSPLPASEPRDAPAARQKRELFQRTLQTGDQSKLRAWLRQTGRIGYLLVGPGRLGATLPPTLRPVGSFQGYTLLRLEPGSERRSP